MSTPDSTDSSPAGAATALTERRERFLRRHRAALTKVEELRHTREQIGQALEGEVQVLQEQGERLRKMEVEREAGGVFVALVRRLSGGRQMLARRTVAEALNAQFQAASTRLRQASAFSDELRLCALELQAEVAALHDELREAEQQLRARSGAVEGLRARLAAVQAGEQELSLEERDRQLDHLSFALREAVLGLEHVRIGAEFSGAQIGPTRALRDTVMALYEGMSRYVLAASASLDAAGRRIQPLSMAADAPVVIAELRESIGDLDAAMSATAAYVQQTREILDRTLPVLTDSMRLSDSGLGQLSTTQAEARAQSLADGALQGAANAEVDRWIKGG